MRQTKINTVLLINALTLFVILINGSCGGGKAGEVGSSDSTYLEFEPADTTAVADSIAVEDYTTYCCSNHTPSHCGVTSELESLTRTHGCIDFRTP